MAKLLKMILLCGAVGLVLPSCYKDNEPLRGSAIYRFKGDYLDLMPVTLNSAKNKVISFSGPGDGFLWDERFIYKVENNYVFDCYPMFGLNIAFLDYSRFEFNDSIFVSIRLRTY